MRKQKNIFILIAVFLALFFALVRYVLGFNGLYGQDSYDYLRFTKLLSEYIKTGDDPGSFFWPVNYPFFGAVFSLIVPSDILSLQLLSFSSFAVSVFLVYKIIEVLYQPSEKQSIMYIIIGFVFSPYLLRASVTVMSDMLALVFTLAAFLGTMNYWKSKRKAHFIYAILFAALAAFTRYHAFVVLFVPMFFSISLLIKRKDYLLFLYASMISLVFILPTIWLKGDSFMSFTGHQWFTDWSPVNWIHRSFSTSDGTASYRFQNLLYGFIYFVHPGFFLLGFLLIPFIRKSDFKNPSAKLIIGTLVFNGLFIAGIPFQNLRFHILVFPYAIVLLFPVFLKLMKWNTLKPIFRNVALLVLIMLQTAIFAFLFEKFYSSNKLEKEIATTIGGYPENPVYTFAIDQAIKTYEPQKEIKNIWYNKYENFQIGSLFLFNEGKFEKQWKNKNPWINWTSANRNHTLKTLETLPEGWVLYEIQ